MQSVSKLEAEDALLELFSDTLGYEYIYGSNIVREGESALYIDQVQSSLRTINPSLPRAAYDRAADMLRQACETSVPGQQGGSIAEWLQSGLEVRFDDGGAERSVRMRLIDYDAPLRNDFHVASGWTNGPEGESCADITVLVNGIPLAEVGLAPDACGDALCRSCGALFAEMFDRERFVGMLRTDKELDSSLDADARTALHRMARRLARRYVRMSSPAIAEEA